MLPEALAPSRQEDAKSVKATRREGLGLFVTVRRYTPAGAVVAEFDGELIVESDV